MQDRAIELADHHGYSLNYIDPVAADIPDLVAIDRLAIAGLVGGAHAQLVSPGSPASHS